MKNRFFQFSFLLFFSFCCCELLFASEMKKGLVGLRTALSPTATRSNVQKVKRRKRFFIFSFTKQELFVDPLKIKGEIAVRRWKEGDRMKPLGMKGSKLISDILSDAKIPHHARHFQLVVHDDEKILWCVGMTVSREATSKLITDNLQLKIRLI